MRLTRVGAVLIIAVVVCGAGVLFASGWHRMLAGSLGCLLLLVMAGDGWGTDHANKAKELARKPHGGHRLPRYGDGEVEVSAMQWARERARRRALPSEQDAEPRRDPFG